VDGELVIMEFFSLQSSVVYVTTMKVALLPFRIDHSLKDV